jgi:uncharacterized protein YciI
MALEWCGTPCEDDDLWGDNENSFVLSGSFPGDEGEWIGMAEWIYFIHPPRENFAATMTGEEKRVWSVHFERFQRLLADGVIVLVGPTLGSVNTGIAIFEAPDEASARRIMDEDPVIAGGYARGELRPFRISLLRGR